MPDTTDNHQLQLFAAGETDWSHSPDMNTLEEIVSLKRNRAPDTQQETPYQDAVFLDLTTGDIYIGDGTSWGTPVWSLGDIGTSSGGDTLGTESNPVDEITNTHYREVTDEATVSGSYTLDITTANVHVLTLMGDTTLTLSGGHSSLTTGASVIIQQDSTGGHTLAWNTPIQWEEGAQPLLSRDADARHKFVLENVAGTWDGAVVGSNYLEVPPLLIENFSAGTDALNAYTGDTVAVEVTDVPEVYNGTYSLKSTSTVGAADRVVSTDGLHNYPVRGDSFGAFTYMSNALNIMPGMVFGADAADPYNNYYMFRARKGADIRIDRRDAGTLTNLALTSVTVNSNQWYEYRVNWGTDDVIRGSLHQPDGTEVASVSATDATYAAESGFGWDPGATDTDTVTFDNARIFP